MAGYLGLWPSRGPGEPKGEATRGSVSRTMWVKGETSSEGWVSPPAVIESPPPAPHMGVFTPRVSWESWRGACPNRRLLPPVTRPTRGDRHGHSRGHSAPGHQRVCVCVCGFCVGMLTCVCNLWELLFPLSIMLPSRVYRVQIWLQLFLSVPPHPLCNVARCHGNIKRWRKLPHLVSLVGPYILFWLI